MMKIIIDGDACSRIPAIERIAKKKHIPCHIYCDASRNMESCYSDIHTVDIGHDSADMMIIKHLKPGDIVITNDTGLATMALARKALVMDCYGKELTDDNIMYFLTARHMRKTNMRKSKRKQARYKDITNDHATQHASFTQTLNALIERTVNN